MKTLFLSSFFVLFLSVATFAGKKETATIKTNVQCDMCKERIEGALNQVDGVKRVEVDVEAAEVTVKYDTEMLSVPEIEKLIANIGYDAGSFKADKKAQAALPDCCQPAKKKSCDKGAKKACCSKEKAEGCSKSAEKAEGCSKGAEKKAGCCASKKKAGCSGAKKEEGEGHDHSHDHSHGGHGHSH